MTSIANAKTLAGIGSGIGIILGVPLVVNALRGTSWSLFLVLMAGLVGGVGTLLITNYPLWAFWVLRTLGILLAGFFTYFYLYHSKSIAITADTGGDKALVQFFAIGYLIFVPSAAGGIAIVLLLEKYLWGAVIWLLVAGGIISVLVLIQILNAITYAQPIYLIWLGLIVWPVLFIVAAQHLIAELNN